MKIVIISNLYPPFVRGGAEIVVGRLAEALRSNLHHVVVITSQPYEGLASLKVTSASLNDVTVHRFFPLNLYYYLNDYKYPGLLRLIWHFFDIFNWHSYLVVKRLLRIEQPDLVITHNLMGFGFLIPSLLRRLRLKHIHTVHDVQLYTPSGLIIKGQEKNWPQTIANAMGYPALMRRLIGSPRAVISPSHFLMNFYKSRGFFPHSQWQILRNPADLSDVLKSSQAAELRLVYLGQISRVKGTLELISIVKRLTNVRLRVIGLGPDLRQALALAKGNPNITFYGWRSRPDILELLGQSDALVMPSICYENSPTVILEALGFGLPVLAADIGGAAELIKDGHNGRRFEAGNWKQLEALIKELAADKTALARLAANCRQSVSDYTVDNYIRQLLRLASS